MAVALGAFVVLILLDCKSRVVAPFQTEHGSDVTDRAGSRTHRRRAGQGRGIADEPRFFSISILQGAARRARASLPSLGCRRAIAAGNCRPLDVAFRDGLGRRGTRAASPAQAVPAGVGASA
jgi:hypothetical protein